MGMKCRVELDAQVILNDTIYQNIPIENTWQNVNWKLRLKVVNAPKIEIEFQM